MAKKKGKNNTSTISLGWQVASGTLREENVGRKHVNVGLMLRMKHLQKLAIWAGGEASIPPLGALFGHHLAANAEAVGIRLDRSLIPCQRCETILQPGYNCTIRIEKNASKAGRHRKACIPSQNNVVYICHFCSHRNLKKGTLKGHMRELLALRPRPISEPNSLCSTDKKKMDKFKKDGPVIPSEKININSSEKRRKMTGLGSSKVAASGPSSEITESGEDNGASSKRRRKRMV